MSRGMRWSSSGEPMCRYRRSLAGTTLKCSNEGRPNSAMSRCDWFRNMCHTALCSGQHAGSSRIVSSATSHQRSRKENAFSDRKMTKNPVHGMPALTVFHIVGMTASAMSMDNSVPVLLRSNRRERSFAALRDQ
eukprot:Amastigsp_a339995_26.p3 type:complete len:134 gc:universal Amastigsp_a339995_26:144-545(+)